MNSTQTGSSLIPLSQPLPWDTGSHFSFLWILYITVLVFGVLINATTFLFMVMNKNIQKLSSVATVKYLVIEDFFSSLACLVQCCMNFQTNGIQGDQTGCVTEAWQFSFFVTITGYTLCLIAYMVRVNITAPSLKKRSRNGFIFRAHIVFWILGAIFATGGTVWPGSSKLKSSGTYCIAAFDRPWPAIFFFGLSVFPTVAFIAIQYLWIFVYVYQAKESLECQQTTKNEHLRLAQQLGSLVVVYFIVYAPFLCLAIYEWSTNYYAPPLSDITGVLVHVGSVANPIMYLWTSNQAKAEIIRLWNENMIGTLYQNNTLYNHSSNHIPTECTTERSVDQIEMTKQPECTRMSE